MSSPRPPGSEDSGWSREPAAARSRRASARRDDFTVHGLDDEAVLPGEPQGAEPAVADTALADTGELPAVSAAGPDTVDEDRGRVWFARHEIGTSLTVVAVIVLAYVPYLSGKVVPGVFGFNSGLATVPIGGFLGHSVGLPWIDPNVGFVSQALGHLSATTLLHGHLPWWNPFEGVGTPLAGEGQSAALFAPTLLLALPQGQVYFHLLLALVAAFGTQRLLRELGVSPWVSAVGGIVFGLNGTFAWLTNAPYNPVAFLPLMLWGVERCRRRPWREGISGWLLIAVGLSGSIYAGFPETAYLNGLLVVCWALLRGVQQPKGAKADYAATVGFGGFVGALLSAPFAAAFVAAVHHADIGGHAQGFATSHLPHAALNTLGVPYLFGPISGFSAQDPSGTLGLVWGNVGGYVTAALVCAAVCGLIAGRDRALQWLLGGWVVVTVARSFGVPPLTSVLRVVPGIHSISFGRYSPPSWEFALVVLAALGVDSFGGERRALRRNRRALVVGAAVALGVVTVALVAGRGLLDTLEHASGFTRYADGSVLWAIVTVVLLVLLASAVANQRVVRLGLGLVLVLDAFVMFVTPEASAPTAIPVDIAPVAYLQQHLGLQRFATLGPIVPNYGSAFGIAEVNAHDLPLPGAWADFVSSHLERNERPQQFDGVAMLDPSGPTPLEELRTNLKNYEAIGVRYVVAPTVWGDIVGRRVYSDRYTSIFELPSTPYFHVSSGHCALVSVSQTEVRSNCARPSVIVRQELNAPGWQATVNGVPQRPAQAGPLFMSVRVPGGRSVVTFSYLPPHMRLAGAAVVLALVLMGVAIIWPVMARRRRPRGP